MATAKGKGTGPNNFAQRMPVALKGKEPPRSSTYIATLLYGSLAAIPAASIEENLPRWTSAVLASNRMKAAEEKIRFSATFRRKASRSATATRA